MSGAKVSGELWQLWALAVAAKACLVLAGAVLITRLMRRRPAAERHLVWVMAVAAVLALPVLTLMLPPQRVTIPAPVHWPSRDVRPAPTSWPAVMVERAPVASTVQPAPPAPPRPPLALPAQVTPMPPVP